MALDDKELELRENYETSKQASIVWRNWLYTIWMGCATLATGAITVAVVFYLIPALSEWKKGNEAWARSFQSSAPAIDRIVSNLESGSKKFDQSMSNIEQASEEFRLTARDVRVDYLPSTIDNINHSVDDIENSLTGELVPSVTTLTNSGRQELERIGAGVSKNLDTLNDNQIKLGRGIDVISTNVVDDVVAFAASLKATGTKLQVYVEDPAIADSIKKSNAILGNIEVMTENTAQFTGLVTKWTDKTLFPPPERGFKGFVKKWILSPLKVVGGVVTLYVRATGGL